MPRIRVATLSPMTGPGEQEGPDRQGLARMGKGQPCVPFLPVETSPGFLTTPVGLITPPLSLERLLGA